MSKTRILSFGVAVFSMIAGSLRANTVINAYSSYGLFNVTAPTDNSTVGQPSIVQSSTVQSSTAEPSTIAQPYSYYFNNLFNLISPTISGNMSPQNCCGPSNTNMSGYQFDSYGFTSAIPFAVIANLQPPVLPDQTTVTVPSIQSSNVSTVTAQIPTISVTTNFNNPTILDFTGDPEPSTVLLFVSGMVALAILYRKRLKTGRGPIS